MPPSAVLPLASDAPTPGLDPDRFSARWDADLDRDGLTNLQEYRAGSDPTKEDSDGDGLPDLVEVMQTHTDVWNQEILSTAVVVELPGAAIVDRLGEWAADNGLGGKRSIASQTLSPENASATARASAAPPNASGGEENGTRWNASLPADGPIYAVSKRGWVEYELHVPRADMYRLEISGGPHPSRDTRDREFPLVLSLDGEYLERATLVAAQSAAGVPPGGAPISRDAGESPTPPVSNSGESSFGAAPIIGSVHTFTPWLAPGPHRVRVFWDNPAKFHSPLAIDSVKLIALHGRDQDGNGVSDWADARLRAMSGMDPRAASILLAGAGAGNTLASANSETSASTPALTDATAPFQQDAGSTLQSHVSPYCLEGRDPYLSMMTLASGGQSIPVQPGAGPRWYANVPLSSTELTRVEASFQNGGLRQAAEIQWTPLDLARVNKITLRPGDSLLISVGSTGDSPVPPGDPPGGREGGAEFVSASESQSSLAHVPSGGSPDGAGGSPALPTPSTITLTVGETHYTGTQPVVVRFDESGTFAVRGARQSDGQTHTLQVTVVGWSFDQRAASVPLAEGKDASLSANMETLASAPTLTPTAPFQQDAGSTLTPAAWTGWQRDWTLPALPSMVALETSSENSLQTDHSFPTDDSPQTDNSPSRFRLQTDAPRTTHVVSRLSESGPILASSEVRGFNFHGGGEAGLEYVERLSEGTRVVELRLVASPVRPQVRYHIWIFVGGITFADGTIEKDLTAADFNELGETTLRLLWPAEAETALCHQIRVYDGTTLLGLD